VAGYGTGRLSWNHESGRRKMNRNNIFLIGPMGAGKTAVGRQLARELSLQFYDTDLEIQQRTGVDIGFIFEKEGEEGFRRREAEAIERLAPQPLIVLATGGGAIVRAQNRQKLSQWGRVVYLRASVAQQLRRTRQIGNRPLLDNASPKETLENLAAQREPIYEDMADLIVDTNGRRVPAVVAEIVNWIEGAR